MVSIIAQKASTITHPNLPYTRRIQSRDDPVVSRIGWISGKGHATFVHPHYAIASADPQIAVTILCKGQYRIVRQDTGIGSC